MTGEKQTVRGRRDMPSKAPGSVSGSDDGFGFSLSPEDRECLNAKMYLMTQNELEEPSFYEHMAKLITHILEHKPDHTLALFETLSQFLKKDRIHIPTHSMRDHVPVTHAEVLAKAQWNLLKKERVSATDDLENNVTDEAEQQKFQGVPNLMRQALFFEMAGVSLPKEEFVRISLSLSDLVEKYPLIQSIRFWGKILGRQKNYYVAETEFGDDDYEEDASDNEADPDDLLTSGLREEDSSLFDDAILPEDLKPMYKPPPKIPCEAAGTGLNKKVYFVSSEPGLPWVRLPHVTPAQIQAARQIRKLLTGDLDAPVNAIPTSKYQTAAYMMKQLKEDVTMSKGGVAFTVDFVEGDPGRMPSRLADRLDGAFTPEVNNDSLKTEVEYTTEENELLADLFRKNILQERRVNVRETLNLHERRQRLKDMADENRKKVKVAAAVEEGTQAACVQPNLLGNGNIHPSHATLIPQNNGTINIFGLISYPPFPGVEKNYLRTQIARITASTHVSPIGYFRFDDEGDEEEEAAEETGSGRGSIIVDAEFEGLAIRDLADSSLQAWVHHAQAILPQGRTTWWNPVESKDAYNEEEEDEEEERNEPDEPEPEVGPPLLTPVAEDENVGNSPSWIASSSSKFVPEYAIAVVQSNVWVGAVAFAADKGKFHENLYIGWGIKNLSNNFEPALPDEPLAEFPSGPEITESDDPTPEEEAAVRAALQEKELEAEFEQNVNDEDDDDIVDDDGQGGDQFDED